MSTGVTVDFNANLARFTGAIDKATHDLNKFQSNAERISKSIGSAFAGLGIGLGVGAFAAMIKGSIDAQDHLLDLSKTTRLSVEDLSGLSSAAKKSGSDLDGTAKAINKLAVEMGKDGEKFKAIGISAKDPLEAFGQLADVMNAIDDPQKRAAVGAIALGKSWQEAAPLLAEGGKAIREMIELGKAYSKVTTESAKRADEFNDKLTDLKTIAGGWTTAVANPIVVGMLKIGKALNLEIDRKPGSISELFFGPKNTGGASGSWGDTKEPAAPGKPSAKALGKFIGGEAGSKGKTDLQRMIELGQKNLSSVIDSEEEQRILAASRAMKDATAEFADLQRMLKVGEENQLAAYYETAGEETMRLVAEQRNLQGAIKDSDNFARDMGLTFSSAFEDAVISGKKLSDVFQGLAQDIARIVLRKTVTEPMGDAITGLIKSSGIGDIFKSLIPKYAQGTPWVPNDGLAYLHQGEQVIPAGKSGGVNVVVNNTAAPEVTATASARANNGGMEIEVIVQRAIARDMSRNGPITQSFGAMFGLGRAV